MAAPHSALISALDQVIKHAEMRPAKLRQARTLIVEAFDGRTATAPTRTSRRSEDSAGALTGRVLAIVREAGADGISPADVVTQAKAPDHHVRLTLKELVADGKLSTSGMTTTKRYRLAKGGGK